MAEVPYKVPTEPDYGRRGIEYGIDAILLVANPSINTLILTKANR